MQITNVVKKLSSAVNDFIFCWSKMTIGDNLKPGNVKQLS